MGTVGLVPAISEFRRSRQEDYTEFKAKLGYSVHETLSLKTVRLGSWLGGFEHTLLLQRTRLSSQRPRGGSARTCLDSSG